MFFTCLTCIMSKVDALYKVEKSKLFRIFYNLLTINHEFHCLVWVINIITHKTLSKFMTKSRKKINNGIY